MLVKKLFAVNVLLVVALLCGCGAQMLSEESATTTTFSEVNGTTSTSVSQTNGTTSTSHVTLVDEPTADGVRTTTAERVSSTTRSTQPSQTTVPTASGSTATTTASTTVTSTSDSTTSTTASTTTTTVMPTSSTTTSTVVSTTTVVTSPTVYTLTPLAASSYYGLSELKRLPNSEALVEAYDRIVEAVENCQTAIVMDEKLTKTEILTVFYYYHADYPQHFWCDKSIRYTISGNSNKVKQIQLQFTMAGDQLRQAQTAFKNAVIDLLKIAATGKDEYEREVLLHDALAKRVTYQTDENAHNAYGALVNGKAVCEGYARAFQYLLYQSGIRCLMVEGSGINPETGLSEGHAWNVVCIDGQYYHVDLTWDDTDDVKTPVMYPYFNLTTAQINENHTIRGENSYALPKCEATANNFHVKNGTRLTECTVDSVARILNKTGDTHIYYVNGGELFADWFKNNHNAVLQTMGIDCSYSFSMLYTGNEVVVRLTTT